MMFTSAFVHWIARGAGSGLRGHALVDALIGLGRHVPALSTARLTVLWYLVPALGAAALIACGLIGTRNVVTRVVAAIAVVVAGLATAAFTHLAGFDHLGWGPKIALAGALLIAVGAWIPDFRIERQELRIGPRRRAQ